MNMSTRNRSADPSYLQWLVGGVCAGVLSGWVAARLTTAGYSPIGILPLGVGASLGAALAWLAVKLGVTGRKRLLAGTLFFAIVAIVAEHAWLYLDFRREWHEARVKDPRVALFRTPEPWSAREYFGRELTAGQGALWALDASLIVAGALGAVAMSQRFRRRSHENAEASIPTLTPDP